jgi:hypothetical protein
VQLIVTSIHNHSSRLRIIKHIAMSNTMAIFFVYGDLNFAEYGRHTPDNSPHSDEDQISARISCRVLTLVFTVG